MKIYANTFELRTPLERRYYAAPNSIFAFAVKATLDGEDADGTITVFQGSTELTPMEATIDGYKLYKRTSGSETAVNEFDIVYTKDTVVQHFTLIETITDSTVFDIDQEGGAFELPIASDSVLGGIKVGQNLTIEADGTLNAKAVPTKTSELINDSGFITENDIPEVPVATTTTAGKVIVGSGLSVDANGKIDALAGEETDPVFNNWLGGTNNVNIGKKDSNTKNILIQGTNDRGYDYGVAIGGNAGYEAIAIGLNYPGVFRDIDGAQATGAQSIAIGGSNTSEGGPTTARGEKSIALGSAAKATANYTIQLGNGTNNTAKTFQVWDHTLLDKDTGNIPEARLSANALVKSTPTAVLSGTYSDGSEFSFDVYIKQ